MADRSTAAKARKVVRRLLRVRYLKEMYLDEVQALRDDAVAAMTRSLYKRYVTSQKRAEKEMPYVDWLCEKKTFENTFADRYQTSQRRSWALRYYQFFTSDQITLSDDPENKWMYEALEEAIDMQHADPDWCIMVEPNSVEAGKVDAKIKGGTVFSFTRIPRVKQYG